MEELKEDIEEDYEGKIVLVTGGAGCIGTNKLFIYKGTFTKERKQWDKKRWQLEKRSISALARNTRL